MISLEQIKQLESKVHGAVGRIKTLASENMTLKKRLEQYEARIGELEELISEFKNDQDEIEQGIVAALSQLDSLEDTVAQQTASSSVSGDSAGEPVSQGVDDAAAEDETSQEAGEDDREESGSPSDDSGGDEAESGADDTGEDEQELDIF